jgi:leader peptidase (prepilin peptidase)/N-methyltransferase
MAAAFAVVVSLVSEPNLIGILGAALAVVAVTIAVIDWRHFIIPDWLNLTGFGLALIHAAVRDPDDVISLMTSGVVRAGALSLIFLALRVSYARLRGRQGLGLGDVKLAAVAGAWLEWGMIPIALQLAVLGALSGYLLRQFVRGRLFSPTGRLPFGFYFAPAIWICWFLELRWSESF